MKTKMEKRVGISSATIQKTKNADVRYINVKYIKETILYVNTEITATEVRDTNTYRVKCMTYNDAITVIAKISEDKDAIKFWNADDMEYDFLYCIIKMIMQYDTWQADMEASIAKCNSGLAGEHESILTRKLHATVTKLAKK